MASICLLWRRSIARSLVTLVLGVHSASWASDSWRPQESAPVVAIWEQEVLVPDSEDRGQYLGTLFEIKSGVGRLLATAGFVGGSQTSAINDHRSVNFYVDPYGSGNVASVARFPGRPYKAGSLFRLMSLEDRLFAYPLGFLAPFRELAPAANQWVDVDSTASHQAKSMRIVSLQSVGSRLLAFFDRKILYGDVYLDLDMAIRPRDELIESGLFFNGRVLLSVSGGFAVNRPYALLIDCAWSVARDRLSDCRRIEFDDDHPDPGRQHVVLGFHALADGRVLLYGLNGFLYEYRQQSLEPLVKIVVNRSWQVYSSIERYGDLLLGQYPSGNLVSLKIGDHLGLSNDLRPWSDALLESVLMKPPVHSERSIRRDEAQSVMTIGPLLAVGMWPWGEVFEGVPGDQWKLVLPTPVSDMNQSGGLHPFEGRTGTNCLGMRVFQIMLWREGYVFQRTVKNEIDSCAKVVGSASEAELDPYGRVYYREVPGLLTCSLPWTGKARRLRFTLDSDSKMRVSLNGKTLCSRDFDGARAQRALTQGNVRKWLSPALGAYGRRTRQAQFGSH